MRVFAIAIGVAVLAVAPSPAAAEPIRHEPIRHEPIRHKSAGTPVAPATVTPATVPPEDTINPFLPEDRSIGECISALPKPGCGSEARGGWRQGVILLAILVGLAFIAWRIVRAARRARLSRTPAATSVPADHGDGPAP